MTEIEMLTQISEYVQAIFILLMFFAIYLIGKFIWKFLNMFFGSI